MESWLNATVRNEARGSVFSMYMAIVYGGMAIGQGPIAILDMTASIGFTIAAICVMLASVPMSLTARAKPALDDDDPLSLRRIFEASPTGAISAVAAGGLIGGGLGLYKSSKIQTLLGFPNIEVRDSRQMKEIRHARDSASRRLRCCWFAEACPAGF
jgi:hypothetical protein